MANENKQYQLGLISDTHGIARPEVVDALRGCELIIHAGDVGKPEVLEVLRRIAPVVAVRGNVDAAPWANALPMTEVVEFAGRYFYVIHDVEKLSLDPVAAGFHAVIYGHSHRPLLEERKGILYINPGSAGPRRFDLPVSAARLRVHDGWIEPLFLGF